jgi:hypothetical protein
MLRAGVAALCVGALSGAAVVAGLSSVAGCAAKPPAASAPSIEQIARELAPFGHAFESLQAALDARDDAAARRILDQVFVRDPQGAALAKAKAFERILDGRALAASLGMRLECIGGADADRFDLAFVAEPAIQSPVRMRTAPASLRCLWIGIDPNGIEERLARSEPLPQLADLELEPGRELRIGLGEFHLPRGTGLAVRASFELEFLAGEFEQDGKTLPAARVRVAPAEAVRLAPFLPTEPVEPAEIARYVAAGKVRMPALLERAVRIPRERRGEALDALTPIALSMDSPSLERIAPALRWLSGNSEIGGEPHAWRAWLDQRRTARESANREPTLDLPERAH